MPPARARSPVLHGGSKTKPGDGYYVISVYYCTLAMKTPVTLAAPTLGLLSHLCSVVALLDRCLLFIENSHSLGEFVEFVVQYDNFSLQEHCYSGKDSDTHKCVSRRVSLAVDG